MDVYKESELILLGEDPIVKANQSQILYRSWMALSAAEKQEAISCESPSEVQILESPGRPAEPQLVDTRALPRRRLGSEAGRSALVHSLAHIEFNAINLALDAVYRFRFHPVQYVDDWLKVASDEGEHFLLLSTRLADLGLHYGALPAHDGLWDMARRTAHDVLVRMALVPRILEARGLDVAPPMIEKLRHVDDHGTADILQRIYTDEIEHVEIGNRWFRYFCEQRSLDGTQVFRDLLRGENSSFLQSPYNSKARLNAGFTQEELDLIVEMEAEYKTSSLKRLHD